MYKTYLVSKTGTYISADRPRSKKNVNSISSIEMAIKIISSELKEVFYS